MNGVHVVSMPDYGILPRHIGRKKGGETVPKSLEEFGKLEEAEAREGGKKVDWLEVAKAIVAAGEAFTVKEVWERFAEKRVGLFRTKNALDTLVEKKLLSRRDDGRRFWYCKPLVEGLK